RVPGLQCDADSGRRPPGRRLRAGRHPGPLPRAGAACPRLLGGRPGAGQGVRRAVTPRSAAREAAGPETERIAPPIRRRNAVTLTSRAYGTFFRSPRPVTLPVSIQEVEAAKRRCDLEPDIHHEGSHVMACAPDRTVRLGLEALETREVP